MKNVQKTHPRALLTDVEVDVKLDGYGWRRSVHQDWHRQNGEMVADFSGWAVEVENFFRVLAQYDAKRKMRICATTADNQIIAEHLVGFSEEFLIARLLMKLSSQEGCNLMFDPIPWTNGKRPDRTRIGFEAIRNEHPFDYYPHPSIFWKVGVSAYQFMSLMPTEMKIEELEYLFDASGLQNARPTRQSLPKLLNVPGSMVLKLDQSSNEAEVLFDEITEDSEDGKEWRWTKY